MSLCSNKLRVANPLSKSASAALLDKALLWLQYQAPGTTLIRLQIKENVHVLQVLTFPSLLFSKWFELYHTRLQLIDQDSIV